jgi:bacillithiol system protein YtxJ
MNWIDLSSLSQWEEIMKASEKRPFVVFKHSTRCSISSMAKNRFEREWKGDENIDAYYLDLLNHRDISNAIADQTGVEHQSPQAILIKNGKAIYNESHTAIYVQDIVEANTAA